MRLIIIVLSFFYQPLVVAGGVSVVGDGGYVVVCRNNLQNPQMSDISSVELLDLYEARLLSGNPELKVTLGPDEAPVGELFAVAIKRAQRLLHLTDHERSELGELGHHFFAKRFDPWGAGVKHADKIISRGTPVNAIVYDDIHSRGCSIETVAVRGNPEAPVDSAHRMACRFKGGGIEHCFLVRQKIYRKMKAGHRACLALHETLRYLPELKRPANDRELRRTVAEICFSPK